MNPDTTSFNKNWLRTLEARLRDEQRVLVEARGWSDPVIGVPVELRTEGDEAHHLVKLRIAPQRFARVRLVSITNVEAWDK